MHSISVLLFDALTDMAEKDLRTMGLSTSTTLSRLDFVLNFFLSFIFFPPEDSLLLYLVLLLLWSVKGHEAAMKLWNHLLSQGAERPHVWFIKGALCPSLQWQCRFLG